MSFDFTFHDLKAKGISDLQGTFMGNKPSQAIKCGTDGQI
ncbi:hypothetical protein SEHO0A_01972 [Salmonella enterica subsp. houtenae str. ATCC BAA-1581]|nr:hypothetical protein SEHO0A_01972 [Salmonella enterica subsp. houtenae str. ATCC BAA-1581]